MTLKNFIKNFILKNSKNNNTKEGLNESHFEKISYSQCAEDLIVDIMLKLFFGITSGVKYLEIGSNRPTKDNNTYYFYKKNGRGVLIEPNIYFKDATLKSRPEDVFLNSGIAFDEKEEAEYYEFDNEVADALNTFSKERAEKISQTYHLANVRTLPLVKVNDVLKKHFPDGIDYLSLDVEGLELDILKMIDYSNPISRPKVFCIESNKTDISYGAQYDIIDFLDSKNYALVADTYINWIFIDTTQMNKDSNIKFKNLLPQS